MKTSAKRCSLVRTVELELELVDLLAEVERELHRAGAETRPVLCRARGRGVARGLVSGKRKPRPRVDQPEFDNWSGPPSPPPRLDHLAAAVDSGARSYCIVCDALLGECAHNARRYLDPVKYDRVGETPDGRTIWAWPLGERPKGRGD